MTKLSRLIYLYFNTIKYLKLIQIFYRFKYKLIKNKPREVVFKIRNQKNSNWIKHYIYDEKLSENGESYFLNTKKILIYLNLGMIKMNQNYGYTICIILMI